MATDRPHPTPDLIALPEPRSTRALPTGTATFDSEGRLHLSSADVDRLALSAENDVRVTYDRDGGLLHIERTAIGADRTPMLQRHHAGVCWRIRLGRGLHRWGLYPPAESVSAAVTVRGQGSTCRITVALGAALQGSRPRRGWGAKRRTA